MASFGFVVLYSAAGGSLTPWAGLHMVRFLVFLGMAIIFSRLKENFWKTIAFPVYIVVVIMLLGVELLGAVRGGSQRWLSLGFIRIQPSELMKPAIILAVARFYDLLPAGQIRTWGAIWPLLLLLSFPCALILMQPDLGTTITVVAGAMTVAFLAGLPMRLFIGGAAAIAVIAPLAYFFALEDYQQRRVTTFLNPENDPLGAGYHISQSKIAIGSGGIFGKGFLNGTQSHLDYLPEGHTDFVFATMAEEWGLMGGIAVLFGFFLLFRWGLGVAMKAKTRFSQLLAAGLSTTIFFYVAINLMMVMGLAPVVGIPLPFLSHGGSSMMTIMICIGILMAIDRHPGRRSGTFG
ncbi:rod shape-determining protein RodA [Parasphingorhabdus litoris]|uniref:Peptidoglycan glycosyltransferase MrdB n=2 Tax=Parasphingorhabdus litoris TaxID=394733 RepID=A0ABP3KP59_9SPHN|nr:rod shape-determining protein RodA [Parasphingorhabdus litoris]